MFEEVIKAASAATADASLEDCRDRVRTLYNPIWEGVSPNGEIIILLPLLCHVAIYVDITPEGGFADRYCILTPELALRAIGEYLSTGEMRYWQKWHNRNLSVAGSYLYPSGELQEPQHAVGRVDWNLDDLRREYGTFGMFR